MDVCIFGGAGNCRGNAMVFRVCAMRETGTSWFLISKEWGCALFYYILGCNSKVLLWECIEWPLFA